MIPQNIFAARMGMQPRSILMPGGGPVQLPGQGGTPIPGLPMPQQPMAAPQPAMRVPMNALQQRLAMLR